MPHLRPSFCDGTPVSSVEVACLTRGKASQKDGSSIFLEFEPKNPSKH